MKVSKLLLGLSVALLITLSTLGAKAYATNGVCEVEGTALGKWGSTLTINGGKISSDFVVEGENCSITMSLVTWKAKTASGQPLYEQKLHDFKTATFGPGQHRLTVNLPDCYYQADLMVGTKADWAEADNTPKRIELPTDGTPWPDGGLRDFKIGGYQKCEEPKKEEPKVLPTSTTAPTELTKTGLGAGSIVGIGASVAVLGAMIHNRVQRKLHLS